MAPFSLCVFHPSPWFSWSTPSQKLVAIKRGLTTQRELASAVERARNQKVGIGANEQKA